MCEKKSAGVLAYANCSHLRRLFYVFIVILESPRDLLLLLFSLNIKAESLAFKQERGAFILAVELQPIVTGSNRKVLLANRRYLHAHHLRLRQLMAELPSRCKRLQRVASKREYFIFDSVLAHEDLFVVD